jgi:hypothetical protein
VGHVELNDREEIQITFQDEILKAISGDRDVNERT